MNRISKKISYCSLKRLKKKKDLLLLAKKLIKKVSDPHNAKVHYEAFLRKKNRKSLKQSKTITYQPKAFQNPNTVYIKPVITEHTHKLPKTIRKGEKVDSNSSLYSHTNKRENVLNQKNVKITKRTHAFKGYASSCNVEILNSFNHELQHKKTEFFN